MGETVRTREGRGDPQAEASQPFNTSQLVKALICVAVGLVIFLIPPPKGLTAQGMHMLGVFVGTILGLILQPLPTSAVAIIGMTVGMLTGALDPKKAAFNGLGSASIWLIVAAFFIAQALSLPDWAAGLPWSFCLD